MTRRSAVAPALLVSSAVMIACFVGCAESDLRIVGLEPGGDAGPSAPGFKAPEEDGGASDARAPTLAMCVATECPSPYATCPDESGRPVYKCQHNLLRDNDNCGECGTVCPAFGPLNMVSLCVNGACEAECVNPDRKDCNGRIEDGCETEILKDPTNCGTCGNECAPGARCRDGMCGCPPGMVDCNGTCVDTSSNDRHCGACNNRCTPPDEPPPPNMEYGCSGGQCGRLRCVVDWDATWRDCNNDLEDGCEVDVGYPKLDPLNCGACGVECAPGQLCRSITLGPPQCVCEATETMCGSTDYPRCVDLLNDPENCGACDYRCPKKDEAHQGVSCRKGLCAYECAPGWGDCNDNPLDGCETNLMVHAGNCGACGKRCDVGVGQPCVEGACLMVECGPGEQK
jgi:hypothetical protein